MASVLLLAFSAARAVALDTIYIVRHAEKATPWPTARELSTYQPLSPEGQARAEKLAERFKGKPLAAVYCSNTTRSIGTAVPLSQGAGIPLVTDDATIKPDQLAGFFEALRARHANDKAVLIVGHSNTIPQLLIALGATPDCHERLGIGPTANGLEIEGYEGVWRVDLAKGGCAGVVRE
jgi:broad specificity phosphatase PhoE